METYEKAVVRYAENGYPNNAIALCNKILRNAPGRTPVYLKLAKLMLERGFTTEAKRNLLEYAERMQKSGQLEQAFHALKEFADLSHDNEEIRLLLAEQLKAAARTEEAREQLAKLYAEVDASGDSRRKRDTLARMKEIDPDYDVESAPLPKLVKRSKSADLVFLDLDDEPAPADEEPEVDELAVAELAVEEPVVEEEAHAPVLDEERRGAVEPMSLIEEQLAEVEATAAAVEALDFEPTSLDEETVEAAAEIAVEGAGTEDMGLEPTALVEATEDHGVDVERVSAEYLDAEEEVAALEGLAVEEEFEAPTPDEVPALDVEPTALDEEPGPPEEAEPEVPEEVEVTPGIVGTGAGAEDLVIEVEERPSVELRESKPGMDVEVEESIWDSVEIGDLEVPDLDFGVGAEPDAKPAVAADHEDEPADVTAEVPPAQRIEDLEGRVADDPDDPELHRALAEALMEAGDRDRGLGELDIALRLIEGDEEWEDADDVVREILRLDPNSVRHHQKRVELAFHRGSKAALTQAYLGLADALLRGGAEDRARAVYQRVLDHDSDNEQAKVGLATLAPVPPEPKPTREVEAPVAQSGDFVDLGALILEDEELSLRDTRMRIEEEEPSGDEQRDFEEMLSEFKRGIEVNLAEEDWQAHYDLGVAFKEMGLLDEAITEFQRALRAPEGKLQTAEALGLCFFENGQFSVAATVLRRAVESEVGGDEEKIGCLYWLGRAEEELQRPAEALQQYQRVYSVDIGFQDVTRRVKELVKAGH
ncbi:MAG: tetratricopeptide repeat protein [Gemmatimonadota bacterium]|nr:tetratricopeptide repeat protein [Gemmatimonadota bacterium]MDH3368132.1 tetratricopeptide repeat protein [Gemmatimonadota bacterium]MDH3479841.1 tetratricopeptide repeat protein [Gemmatimonadota bacterium]MDH3569256.1 tetratricopeptide repeat protein [Gemmatimonadota bacterium]MDH5549469.1 tetratricopeptide repeat protein [Gemmatimonadota bacterium]